MAIVCGTDSAQCAGVALEVAALVARRMRLSLHLVHDAGTDPVTALQCARALAQRASERLDGDVHLHVMPVPFVESLVQVALRVEATLLVLGAPDHPTRAWCAGTVDELIRRAPAPLLIVREALAFDGWASGTRPLVVVLDADFSAASRRASSWVEKLAKLGPCEVVVAHQYETLATPSHRAVAHGLAGVATARASVERELRTWLDHLEGDLQLRTRLLPRRARYEVKLAECAIEEAADLVVLGQDVTKPRHEKLVSRLHHLLQATDCSLLFVPSRAAAL